MAPPKGRRSSDQPASAGVAGEWQTVQSERTVGAAGPAAAEVCARGSLGGAGFAAVAVRAYGWRG
eukprot:417337-Alexandrium_andersonii.AAC.1